MLKVNKCQGDVMPSRRDFLRVSAMAAAAGCVLGRSGSAFGAGSEGLIYGVQLFMVRRQAPQDLAGVLKAIHQIGYAQIELYPIVYNHPPAELRKIVTDAGLGLVSAHFDYDGFESRIDYGKQLGLKYMVCPMLPQDQWTSLDGFKKAATDFNKWGKGVKDAGMEFCFHNHCYEFKPYDGSNGFAVLMKDTDPALVKLEFDLYWLTQAGQNPSEMMKKYADRLRLVHLKDRTPAPPGYEMGPSAEHFTELGKGTIAWPSLLEQAKKQGVKYAFVDQDETAGPVLESLKVSYGYLKTLNV
jgi:sugar phosphate isomerase/epimerase